MLKKLIEFLFGKRESLDNVKVELLEMIQETNGSTHKLEIVIAQLLLNITEQMGRDAAAEPILSEVVRIDAQNSGYQKWALQEKMELKRTKATEIQGELPLEIFINKEYIQKGWKLINIFPKRINVNTDLVTYILGRYELPKEPANAGAKPTEPESPKETPKA